MRTIKQLLTLTTYVTAGTPESSIHKTTCLEEQKARAVTGPYCVRGTGLCAMRHFPIFY